MNIKASWIFLVLFTVIGCDQQETIATCNRASQFSESHPTQKNSGECLRKGEFKKSQSQGW